MLHTLGRHAIVYVLATLAAWVGLHFVNGMFTTVSTTLAAAGGWGLLLWFAWALGEADYGP